MSITKPGEDSPSAEQQGSEHWGGEEDEQYDDEEFEGEEEEAEEIARRLRDQLWADISKAQADRANATVVTSSPSVPVSQTPPTTSVVTAAAIPAPPTSKKEEAAIATMKSILTIAGKDFLACSTLASTVIPGSHDSVLDALNSSVSTGSIPKDLAKALSHLLVSLARSDALFGTLRHSNAPAIQLDKGKRKRDEDEEERRQIEARALKRPAFVHNDLHAQITEAVRLVTHALTSHTPSNRPLDASLIGSIQLQLHQVFLFAVTSSAAGGPEMNALQEISGLIQVLGVLSGIQIGPTLDARGVDIAHNPHSSNAAMYTSRPWQPPGVPLGSNAPFTDIGTAVYPCLVPGCCKTFSRLYSLRAHQRVHAVHRPFRCAACPASFARNHDLKRHAKLHDKKAWQCAGCDKMFSRRDAIKRHKNNSRARGGKGEVCVSAAIREVELDKEAEDEIVREGRRAKMWSDIVGNQIGGAVAYGTSVEDSGLEEGEIRRELVGRVRSAVMSLHGVLQAHVSSALGTPSDQAVPPLHLDPTGGQATLASVIARAQLQALPSQIQPPQGPPMAQQSHAESPAASASRDGHVTGYDDTEADYATAQDDLQPPPSASPGPALSLYGLSEEQTKLLEQAIANAASAAQAQAEAEAAMEEEEDDYEEDEEEYEEENQAVSIPA